LSALFPVALILFSCKPFSLTIYHLTSNELVFERRVTERKAPPLHLPLLGRRVRFLCSLQKSLQGFCHGVTFPNRFGSLHDLVKPAPLRNGFPRIYYVYSPKAPQSL